MIPESFGIGESLGYFDHILNATSIEEIWAHHTEMMASFGFDRLLYAFTRFMPSKNLGLPEDCLILTNHPQDYVDEYIHGGLYKSAPMVLWVAENQGCQPWWEIGEKVRQRGATPGEMKVFELNRRYQVNAGYSIGFPEISYRARGGIGLCAKPGLTNEDVDAIWAKHGCLITVLNKVMHLRVTSLPYHTGRQLTPRQCEALEWVGEGKTNQDIATIMGLTPATVEKHLRLAREALEVETTAQAVLIASLRNQIFLLPEHRQGRVGVA
ncbi:MAG: LuxR family transcriptional regulator [Paracoccaceae bacterium]